MRHNWLIAATLALALAATIQARTIQLKGGKLTTIDDSTVETFGDDLNFCFAYRFSDGTIHMNHSQGIHTVTEYGCCDMSKDNGHTWIHRAENGNCGINSFEGLDGGKYNYGCWDLKYSKAHDIVLKRFNEETEKMDVVCRYTLEMPFSCQFLMHRDAIRLPNGRILATYYGHIENAPKCHIGVIASDDDGRTWQFLGIMADDPEGKTVEGPDESTIFQLRDGRICALYRDDGNAYVKQCFSSDDGVTWTKPEAIELFKGAASPNGRVLSDGTIVAVTGRPNLYLLVDFSGTGTDYQKVDIYRGAGSSYASVLETAPNEILIIYDESNFGGRNSPNHFARIHAVRYKLERTDDNNSVSSDPRSTGYDVFYSPLEGKTPLDKQLFYGHFKKKGESDICYYEILNIPERPNPVLRLVAHGDITTGTEWANFISFDNVAQHHKIELGIEFRLNDAVEPGKNGQFHIFVPAGGNDQREGGYHGYVAFGKDKVTYLADGNPVAVPCDIGSSFHKYKFIIDADAGKQELFIDDAETPVFSVGVTENPSGTQVIFGDGSRDIYGTVDISYIGWKILK